MADETFAATVRAVGARAQIVVPFEPDAAWGARARHSVTGSVAGHPFRGKVEASADGPCLYLGPAWRRDNGVEVGDEVEVIIRPEGPQLDTMEPDVAIALAADAEARANFEGLTTFCRKNYMRWIDGAKRPETRARRIAEMLPLLRRSAEERVKAP
ncbi:MAG: YdeI/OmpD-associated family protein [Armatimonadetes bacterium]|nr:YdeI/OmpD-associated family protein [Armatimonadota bacterium]